MRSVRSWLPLLALSCTGTPDEPGPPKPDLLPFPSMHHMVDGHVQPSDPLPAALTPVPVERWVHRAGFSPVQTAVVDLGVAIDPTSLPGLDQVGEPGSVVLWDLTTSEAIPAFAELDAHPSLEDVDRRLLIRPLRPVPAGHQVAVAITTAVRTADGQPLPAAGWFGALLDGQPSAEMEPWQDHYTDLADTLAAAGIGELAMAFDYPVSDGTAPMRAMLAAVEVPVSYDLEETEDEPPPRAWKRLAGTFETVDWLGDNDTFTLDAAGLPIVQGTTRALLDVYIPDSLRDAEPGSAPIWLFGHGIFAHPGIYLDEASDESAVQELADRAGAIVVATVWRGLTTSDVGVPFNVATDFGRFPELTDRLAQGVANTAALLRLVREGDLLGDPAFAGLGDPTTVRYYGISLGGIEGAVLAATVPELPHAVLHVGGSTWSTMLERSVHWKLFEDALSRSIDDPGDRQLLYAASQLFWDPIDPASYAEDLRGRSVLWQVARGDDQVPNLSTFTLARGVQTTLLEPSPLDVYGLDASPTPGTPALAIFDPEEGNSEGVNRPADDTTSHETPRTWEGARLQVLRFLDAEDPGVVEHFCADVPCTPAQTGP